jgi:hypothetical protein
MPIRTPSQAFNPGGVLEAYIYGLNETKAEEQRQFENKRKTESDKLNQDKFTEAKREFDEQLKRLTDQFGAEQKLKQAKHDLLVKKLKGEMSVAATKGAKYGPASPTPAAQDDDFINNLISGKFGANYGMSQDLGGELGQIEYNTPEKQAQIESTLVEPKIKQAVESFNRTYPARAALASMPIQAALDRQETQNKFTAGENEKNRENALNVAKIRGQFSTTNRQNISNPAVMRLVSQHDTNPITKRFVLANEAMQFVNAMPLKSENPADDIGIIYAFAKGMDLESVVREGEYKTIQDYAQALFQKAGIRLNRVFNNEGFLTTDARTKLKQTLQTKSNATAKMYRDFRKGQVGRIETILPGQGEVALGSYLAEGTTPIEQGKNEQKKTMIRLSDGSLIPDTPANRTKHGL